MNAALRIIRTGIGVGAGYAYRMRMAPLIIAHRTCPTYAAENSIEGIHIAAEQGADGVEIDLRMSLDQRPYLMHDYSMRRTTGFPLPLELTPSALIDTKPLPNGELVPTLHDVLDALPASMLLAVDVKTPWAVMPLVRAIKKRRIEDRVLIWCTSATAVRYAVANTRGVEIAYLKDSRDPRGKRELVWKAKRLGAHAISAHWLAIDEGLVTHAHENGLRVYSWHGGHAITTAKIASGLDGLISDFPEDARAQVESIPTFALGFDTYTTQP